MEETPLRVEDEDVVSVVIGQQEKAAIGGLNHFMAVPNGVRFRVRLAPEFIDAVNVRAVSDPGVVKGGSGFALGADEGGDRERGGGQEELPAGGGMEGHVARGGDFLG